MGLAGREHERDGCPAGQAVQREEERVATARALANAPGVLLADEPTGNLDVGTSGVVFDEVLRTVRTEGMAALIVTHNLELAAQVDQRVTLQSENLVNIGH